MNEYSDMYLSCCIVLCVVILLFSDYELGVFEKNL